MPAKPKGKRKRWVAKGAPKRKGWRKTGVTRKKKVINLCPHKFMIMTQGPFPTELRTKFVASGLQTMPAIAGNVVRQYSWYANAFGNGTTGTSGVGPQVNGAGVFTTIYPVGLYYMISTPVITSSNSPYAFYRVLSSTLYFRVIPQNITAGQPNSACIRIGYMANENPAQYNMTGAQFFAQPNCREVLLQNPVNTTLGYSTAVYPDKFHSNHADIAKIFGRPRSIIENEDDYAGAYNAVPSQTAYHTLLLTGDNTTNLFNGLVEWKIVYDVICYARNNLSNLVNI